MGPTRSLRLPRSLDEWFSERLERHRERSPSEVLVQLIHGGLRLREGYMAVHHCALEQLVRSGQAEVYAAYVRCLTDTFSAEYVAHLEDWLAAERVGWPSAPSKNGRSPDAARGKGAD